MCGASHDFLGKTGETSIYPAFPDWHWNNGWKKPIARFSRLKNMQCMNYFGLTILLFGLSNEAIGLKHHHRS